MDNYPVISCLLVFKSNQVCICLVTHATVVMDGDSCHLGGFTLSRLANHHSLNFVERRYFQERFDDVQVATLPFEGKNLVLYSRGKARAVNQNENNSN